MPFKGKHVAIAGGALVLFALLASTVKAAGTAKNLETRLFPKISGFKLFGDLIVDVDAQIHNPTGGSLAISNPVIELFRPPVTKATAPIASTSMKGTIRIAPNKSLRLSDPGQLGKPITLAVPTAQIISAIPEAMAALTGVGGPFVLEVRVKVGVKAPNVPAFTHTITEQLAITSPI